MSVLALGQRALKTFYLAVKLLCLVHGPVLDLVEVGHLFAQGLIFGLQRFDRHGPGRNLSAQRLNPGCFFQKRGIVHLLQRRGIAGSGGLKAFVLLGQSGDTRLKSLYLLFKIRHSVPAVMTAIQHRLLSPEMQVLAFAKSFLRDH